MGSRLVYDYHLQKWIPNISDPDAWYQYMLDVRDGHADCDSQGCYIVSSGRKYRDLKETEARQKAIQLKSISPSFRNVQFRD